MNTNTADLMKQLENGFTELVVGDNFANYLKTMAKFHHYSFNNIMLIVMQYPEASQVAGYKKWQEMGRNVRKGEKGIRILAPCPHKKTVTNDDGEETEIRWTTYRPVSVFDIAQTDGKELPEICRKLTGEVSDYEALMEGLKKVAQVAVSFENITNGANGYYSKDMGIVLNEGMEQAQTVKTFIHEIAHSILHKDSYKCREQKEVEAESVAYVVCQALGIDSGDYTFGYLAGWASGDTKFLKQSLNDIQKCADKIITALS